MNKCKIKIEFELMHKDYCDGCKFLKLTIENIMCYSVMKCTYYDRQIEEETNSNRHSFIFKRLEICKKELGS